MPKDITEQIFPYNTKDVTVACQEAVAQLGWSISEQSDNRILCKELRRSMLMGSYPVNAEITWQQVGSNTQLVIKGVNSGIGPIQSRHLKDQMGNLLNRIQICLHKAPPLEQKTAQTVAQPTTQVSLADELEKLTQLHVKGFVSDDEFSKAKAKLLDSAGH